MRIQASFKNILKPGLALGLAVALVAGGYWLVRDTSIQSGGNARTSSLDTAGIKAMVDTYCTECHNFEDYSGGLDLEGFDFAQISNDAETGEKIIRKLSAGVMPPSGKERPDAASHAQLVSGLETLLDKAWADSPRIAPPGVHRLNRREYANAIRDLLALEVDPAKLLPVDDTSYGFDNMAGSLGTSPALIEAYVSAAAKISRLALGHELGTTRKEYHAPPDYSQNRQVEGLSFGTRGGLLVHHYFPADGEYLFNWAPVRSNAGGMFGEEDGEMLELTIDGERVKVWNLADERPRNMADERYVVRVPVTAGMKTVGLGFISRSHVPSEDLNQHFERTTLTQNVGGFTFAPHVNAMSIAGPFEGVRPDQTTSRDRVFVCRPAETAEEAACARTILSSMAEQAYRRPITDHDMELLMSFYEAGREQGDFETGVQQGLQLILSDPAFIYRAEKLPADAVAGQAYPVSELELASRLSFFLWSSLPDEELLTLAEQGKLREPAMMEQQVQRMMADSRSTEFVSNFAGQWLQLRNLQSAAPVASLFPDFDDNLRQALRIETEMFFESVMREDRPVTELLDANYTFLNERLARHYGIPGIYGSQFRRVELAPEFDMRRGLLGKGSFLTVSSVADRTSTVLRGKWVLLNILGVVPPDPPPNVPVLAEKGATSSAPQTMRQRMEEHGSDPACASCHLMMDPIGFALDSFDRTGRYRTAEFGQPLNLAGKLVDGQEFNGPTEMRQALMHYAPQFVQTMAERMLTYALGRGVEYYDMPVVRNIVRNTRENDNRFSAMVLGIVESQPFQSNQVAAENITAAR